jgi:oxygen-independent coproporphyrinogen-3 oxidase
MEMNPATVSPESLIAYRSLGVSRASFGLQTFDDAELKRLARGHNAADAITTFQMLRDCGFSNVSFDLIAGLPGQTADAWKLNLDKALALDPEHLSLYLLEIHEGTPLAEQIKSQRQPEPDDETAAEMYGIMLDKVTAGPYRQYEISNFAKRGFESRHNVKYWLLEPVYGFGVSAHSFNGRQRYANERDTARYVEMIEKGAGAEVFRSECDTASESAFLGLRLTDGIDTAEYTNRFNIDISRKYRDELSRFADADLVEFTDGRLRLTQRGMLFSNEVFAAFV